MPSISIQAGSAAITAASNQGVATVSSADLLNIYPGAWAWLAKTDGSGTPKKVKVIQILSTTTFLVRVFANDADEYGNGQHAGAFYTTQDISAFNASSTIYWWTQSVPIDPAFSKRNEA